MSRGGVRRRLQIVDLLLVLAGLGAGCLLSICLWFVVLELSPRHLVPNFVDRAATLRWWLYPRFFVHEGDRLVSNHPRMPHRTFPAVKPAGAYRVFLTGGSQAMGDPYVHVWPETETAEYVNLSLEDRGGIGMWLQQYLELLHPERQVEVINVAIAGQNSSTIASQFAEIVRVGDPDLVIVLSGNNEWPYPEIAPADHERTLAEVTARYAASLDTIARTAEEAGVLTYVLTVPGNLRDWVPSMYQTPGREAARELLAKKAWERGVRHLERMGAAESALYFYFRARAREAAGDLDGAHRDYIEARDRDAALNRAPSSFNDAVLRLEGHHVRVFHLEEALRQHARGGIPGFDLFHDYCHMKIRGYMLAAKEIALFHQRDQKLAELDLPDLNTTDKIRESLHVLYEVKARKWAGLTDGLAAARLGAENIANVRKDFDSEQDEIDDVRQAIRRYERDLEPLAENDAPGLLTQVECAGVDCMMAAD